MERSDVINRLIEHYKYKSYLEIGLNNPEDNYDKIICENKESCDPYDGNADFIGYYNKNENLGDNILEKLTYRMTSDDMFSQMPADKMFDIVFIDGLHEERQVERDIINSLNHLNDGGSIVIHDCLPLWYDGQLYPRPESTYWKSWNGNVWKGVAEVSKIDGIELEVVDCDYGCGVIRVKENHRNFEHVDYDSELTWDDFCNDRDGLMHVITSNYFLEKYDVREHHEMVAVCTIVKMENLYLRDWVEHYKKIGFDNIILYDNNDINGEYPQQVIGDYIDDGFVIYHNYRGVSRAQIMAYNSCINDYWKDMTYDWIAFFDCDEYLHLKWYSDVHQYFADKKYDEHVLSIGVSWKNISDSDEMYYKNECVESRFNKPEVREEENFEKYFVHISGNGFVELENTSYLYYTTFFNYNLLANVETDSCMELYHYRNLSTMEYLCKRLGRRTYANDDIYDTNLIVDKMYKLRNDVSPKKLEIINNFLSKNYLEKKNIAIRCYLSINEDRYYETGVGGTEGWVIEIGKQFIEMGYNVFVFYPYTDEEINGAKFIHPHVGKSGIFYYDYSYFDKIINEQTYHCFINIDLEDVFNQKIKCDNLYEMHHTNFSQGNYDKYICKKIVKHAVLSKQSKDFLMTNFYKDSNDRDYFMTINGVNQELYADVDLAQKKNMMVWSSQPERMFKYFVKYIYPIVKAEVPDFEVILCGYSERDYDNYINGTDIKYVGNLSKKELAELQKKSKIWTYTNFGLDENCIFTHETFCLSAVENGLAKNAIVCLGNKDGIQTVFDGYDGFVDASWYNEFDTIYENNFEQLCKDLARQTIKVLKDDEYREHLVSQTYEMAKRFTWKRAAATWVKELGDEDYVKHMSGIDVDNDDTYKL